MLFALHVHIDHWESSIYKLGTEREKHLKTRPSRQYSAVSYVNEGSGALYLPPFPPR